MMGIMGRARGLQIGENGVHVAVMFLLLGFLLSVVNLPGASGDTEGPSPNPPQGTPLQAAPPGSEDLSPPPPPLPPPAQAKPAPPTNVPPPPPAGVPPSPAVGPVPPPVAPPSPESTRMVSPPAPPPGEEGISPSSSPSPSPIVRTGNSWNESEKAGVVIAAIAALLQVAVVGFLLIKRHQMLTTAEYGDIDDLEYENPRDSNFRHAESV